MFFFFSSRRGHTRFKCDWSSDVCSSDLRGRIVFDRSMEEVESRYVEVVVNPEKAAAARALQPMHERQVFGRTILLLDAVERNQLAALGDVRTPSIADLFVAVMENQAGRAQGVTR